MTSCLAFSCWLDKNDCPIQANKHIINKLSVIHSLSVATMQFANLILSVVIVIHSWRKWMTKEGICYKTHRCASYAIWLIRRQDVRCTNLLKATVSAYVVQHVSNLMTHRQFIVIIVGNLLMLCCANEGGGEIHHHPEHDDRFNNMSIHPDCILTSEIQNLNSCNPVPGQQRVLFQL